MLCVYFHKLCYAFIYGTARSNLVVKIHPESRIPDMEFIWENLPKVSFLLLKHPRDEFRFLATQIGQKLISVRYGMLHGYPGFSTL